MSRLIGKPLLRIEDEPLLLGAGKFAADYSPPGLLHMRIVRSPVAHGRILNVDVSDALALDGVVCVLTHSDVAHIPPIAFRQEGLEELMPYR